MSRNNLSSRFTMTEGEVPAPPPLIGALLRRPLQVVRQHMLERLHESGFDDLDAAHLVVLQYPGPQGLRPSELATRVGMSKQAVNYQLGQLERLGYLIRQQHSEDQRSKRISLTDRGYAAIPVIRDAVAEVEARWASELGSDRFAQIRELLVELNERIPPD
jgi:DNA-binding MarR family transcriptional regulator